MEYKLPPIFEGRTFKVTRQALGERKAKLWLASTDGEILVLIHPAESRLVTYYKKEPDMGIMQLYRGVGDPAKDKMIGEPTSLG